MKYRRVKTDESIDKLRNKLIAQDWGIIHKEKDINKAYDEILKIFNVLYDENCPIKQQKTKKHNPKDNQFTKGLWNACINKKTDIENY